MNSFSKWTGDEIVISMLEKYEAKKYRELVDIGWKVLYSRIIPFNSEDIHALLANYIVILTQAISEEEVTEEATKILSIVDLIIHPRKGTIIEGNHEIDDLVEEIPPAPFEEEQREEKKEEEGSKRLKIDIIE